MKRYALVKTGDELFATAAVRTVVTVDIPATREQVWDTLCADDAVVSWSPLVTAAHWATDRGPGAIRQVTLGGALTVREVFYRWEPAHRMTFSADSVSLPGIFSFGEDYLLTDLPGGGTQLTWTVATDPKAGGAILGKPASLLLKPAINNLARGLRRTVARTAVDTARTTSHEGQS